MSPEKLKSLETYTYDWLAEREDVAPYLLKTRSILKNPLTLFPNGRYSIIDTAHLPRDLFMYQEGMAVQVRHISKGHALVFVKVKGPWWLGTFKGSMNMTEGDTFPLGEVDGNSQLLMPQFATIFTVWGIQEKSVVIGPLVPKNEIAETVISASV